MSIALYYFIFSRNWLSKISRFTEHLTFLWSSFLRAQVIVVSSSSSLKSWRHESFPGSPSHGWTRMKQIISWWFVEKLSYFFLFSTEDISAHILNEYNPSAQLPSVVMVTFDSSDIFCFRERLISQKRVADWLKAIMLGAVEPSSK